MNMVPVDSSNLAAVGYDESASILYITFNNGWRYMYFDVPSEIYRGLLNASSKGKYHHAYIKNAYRCQRC